MKFTALATSLILLPFAASASLTTRAFVSGQILSPTQSETLAPGQHFLFSYIASHGAPDRKTLNVSARIDGTGGDTEQYYVAQGLIPKPNSHVKKYTQIPSQTLPGYFYLRVFENVQNTTTGEITEVQGSRLEFFVAEPSSS